MLPPPLPAPTSTVPTKLKASQILHLPYLVFHPDLPTKLAQGLIPITLPSSLPYAGSSHFLLTDSFSPVKL